MSSSILRFTIFTTIVSLKSRPIRQRSHSYPDLTSLSLLHFVNAQLKVNAGRFSITSIIPPGVKGNKNAKRKTTYVSPRPKGHWKTYFGRLFKQGRDILDAQLISRDGSVVLATPEGIVLDIVWAP